MNVVVVHDGARPIVPQSLVMELVRGAEQHGAAGAVRPLVSTVLRVTSDSFLADSLDRSLHVASETPQAFQLEILTMAYNKVLAYKQRLFIVAQFLRLTSYKEV